MSEQDDVDATLRRAGERLRATSPDEVTARQALARVNRLAETTPPPATSGARRWPLMAGLGLTAAAAIGVVALGVFGDDEETLVIPADTATTIEANAPSPPTTTASAPEPSTPTTLDATEPTEPPAPTGPPTTLAVTGDSATTGTCTTADIEVDGLIACTDQWNGRAVIVDDGATGEWELRTPDADPVPLGTATPLPDGVPGRWLFAEHGADQLVEQAPAGECLIIVPPDGDGWRQTCGYGVAPTGSFITALGDRLVQIDTDGSEVYAATDVSDGVWPASGCDGASMRDATSAIVSYYAHALLSDVKCEGDAVALDPESPARLVAVTGSGFLPWAAVDGLIFVVERVDGEWTVVDAGTGIEDAGLPIPTNEQWTAWPGDTAPVESLVDVGLIPGGALTLGDLADSVVDLVTAATPSTEEFPATVTLVDTAMFGPGFTAVVVVETVEPGDDSVAGRVSFVWAGRGPAAEAEWQVIGASVSQTCLRGGGLDSPLCT